MKCPNKSSKEYQLLVKKFGEENAFVAWYRNGEEIPDIHTAYALLENNIKLEEIPNYEMRFFNEKSQKQYESQLKDKATTDAQRKVAEILLKESNRYKTVDGNTATVDGNIKIKRVHTYLDEKYPEDKFEGNYAIEAEQGNQADELLSLVVTNPNIELADAKKYLQQGIDERNASLAEPDKHTLYYTDEILKDTLGTYKELVAKWKKNGNIILTQVGMFNLDKKVGGTADIVLIDRNGIATILDLKTSGRSVLDSTYMQNNYTIRLKDLREQIGVYEGELQQDISNERRDTIRYIIDRLKAIERFIRAGNTSYKAARNKTHTRQLTSYKAILNSKGITVGNMGVLPLLRVSDKGKVLGLKYELDIKGNEYFIPLLTDEEVYPDLDKDVASGYKSVVGEEPNFNKALDRVKAFLETRLGELKQYELSGIEAAKIRGLEKEIKYLESRMALANAAGKINLFIEDVKSSFGNSFNGYIVNFNNAKKEMDKAIKDNDIKGLKRAINQLNEYRMLFESYLAPIHDLKIEFEKNTSINLESNLLHGSPLQVLMKMESEMQGTLVTIKEYQKEVQGHRLLMASPASKLNKDIAEASKKVAKYEKALQGIEEKIKGAEGKRKENLKAKRDSIVKEIEAIRKLRPVDAQMVIDELSRLGEVDITWLDMMANPLSHSSNKAVAMFVNLVSNAFKKADMALLQVQSTIYPAYQKYKKWHTDTNGAGTFNDEKFFKGIYETSSYLKFNKETGTYEAVPVYSFVEDFDRTSYNNSYVEVYKKYKDAITSAETPKERYSAATILINWGKENLVPVDIKEEFAVYAKKLKKGLLSKNAYNQMILDSVSRQYKYANRLKKGEKMDDYVRRIEEDMLKNPEETLNYFNRKNVFLTENRTKYPNKNYKALYYEDGTLNPMGEFHKALTDQYLLDQAKYPLRKRLGLILPYITKSGKERFYEGPLGYAKYNFSALRSEKGEEIEEYGFDTDKRLIPTQFTTEIPMEDVSLDLISSVMRFANATERYKAAVDVHADAQVMMDIIKENMPVQTDSKGLAKLDKALTKLGMPNKYSIKHNGNRLASALEWFIDNNIYGKTKDKEYMTLPLVGRFRYDKVSDALLRFMSFTQIGGDFLLGMSNSLMANNMLLNEARASEWFNIKEMNKAKGIYLKYATGIGKLHGNKGSWIGEYGNPIKTSFVGQLEQFFSPMRGQFSDEFGHNVSGTAAKKLLDTNTWFALMHEGEREAAMTTLMAMLEHKKLKDADGKEHSMLDLLIDNYNKTGNVGTSQGGKKGFKEGIDVSNVVLENGIVDTELINSLYAITNRMHGVYNNFDKVMAKRTALGRLIMVYRNHMVPGFKRRFKPSTQDINLGITEGTYITFFRSIVSDFKETAKAAFSMHSELTPYEQANVRRAAMEMAQLILLSIIALSVKGLATDDDEKKNKLAMYPLYLAVRLNSEMKQYIPLPGIGLKDFVRTMFNPTAAYSVIKKTIKLADDFFKVGEDRYYQRDVNWMAHKGDAKWWVDLRRLLGNNGRNFDPGSWIPMYYSMTGGGF